MERTALNFSNAKNAKIIRVCTKLHNFCICMNQMEESNRIGAVGDTQNMNPLDYNIEPLPLHFGNNQIEPFGYLPTSGEDDDYRPMGSDSTRRDEIVAELDARGISCPTYNKTCNMEL